MRPPDPRDGGLELEHAAEPALDVRPEDEQDGDEPDGERHRAHHDERDEALLHEAAPVLEVVGAVEPGHVRRHRARRRPEREHEAEQRDPQPRRLLLLELGEAVAEEAGGLRGNHLVDPVHELPDRVRPGQEAEQAERQQQRGGNHEERAVRERGCEQRELVVERLPHGSPEDPRPFAKRGRHTPCSPRRPDGKR